MATFHKHICLALLTVAAVVAVSARGEDLRFAWVAERLDAQAGAAGAPRLVLQTSNGETVAESRDCRILSQEDDRWICGRIDTEATGTFVLKLGFGDAAADLVLNDSLEIVPRTFDVALVIDASYSMRENDPDDLRFQAMRRFYELALRSRAIRTISVLAFRDETEVLLEPTAPADIVDIDRLMRRIRSSGTTDFNSPFEKAEQVLRRTDAQRKAVLFLSDGKPRREYTQAHRLLGDRGYPVYTVGLSAMADADLLSVIAEETGGQYFDAPSADQLKGIFAQVFRLIGAPRTILKEVVDVAGTPRPTLVVDSTMHNPILTVATLSGDPRVNLSSMYELGTDAAGLSFHTLPTDGAWMRDDFIRFDGVGRVLIEVSADTDLYVGTVALNTSASVGLPLAWHFYLPGEELTSKTDVRCTVHDPRGTVVDVTPERNEFGLYSVTYPQAQERGRYRIDVRVTGMVAGAGREPFLRQAGLSFTRTSMQAGPVEGGGGMETGLVEVTPTPVESSVLPVSGGPGVGSGTEGGGTDAQMRTTFWASADKLAFDELYPGIEAKTEIEVLINTDSPDRVGYSLLPVDAENVRASMDGELYLNRRSTFTLAIRPDTRSAGATFGTVLQIELGEKRWTVPITGHVSVPVVTASLGEPTVTESDGTTSVEATLTVGITPQGICDGTLACEEPGWTLGATNVSLSGEPLAVPVSLSVPTPGTDEVREAIVRITGPGLETVTLAVKVVIPATPPVVIEPVPALPAPSVSSYSMPAMLLLGLLVLILLLLLLSAVRGNRRAAFILASILIHAAALLYVVPKSKLKEMIGAPVTTMNVTSAPPIVEEAVAAETESENAADGAPAENATEKEDAATEQDTADAARDALETDEQKVSDNPDEPAPVAEEQERDEMDPAQIEPEPTTVAERKKEEAAEPDSRILDATQEKADADLAAEVEATPRELAAKPVEVTVAQAQPTTSAAELARDAAEPQEIKPVEARQFDRKRAAVVSLSTPQDVTEQSLLDSASEQSESSSAEETLPTAETTTSVGTTAAASEEARPDSPERESVAELEEMVQESDADPTPKHDDSEASSEPVAEAATQSAETVELAMAAPGQMAPTPGERSLPTAETNAAYQLATTASEDAQPDSPKRSSTGEFAEIADAAASAPAPKRADASGSTADGGDAQPGEMSAASGAPSARESASGPGAASIAVPATGSSSAADAASPSDAAEIGLSVTTPHTPAPTAIAPTPAGTPGPKRAAASAGSATSAPMTGSVSPGHSAAPGEAAGGAARGAVSVAESAGIDGSPQSAPVQAGPGLPSPETAELGDVPTRSSDEGPTRKSAAGTDPAAQADALTGSTSSDAIAEAALSGATASSRAIPVADAGTAEAAGVESATPVATSAGPVGRVSAETAEIGSTPTADTGSAKHGSDATAQSAASSPLAGSDGPAAGQASSAEGTTSIEGATLAVDAAGAPAVAAPGNPGPVAVPAIGRAASADGLADIAELPGKGEPGVEPTGTDPDGTGRQQGGGGGRAPGPVSGPSTSFAGTAPEGESDSGAGREIGVAEATAEGDTPSPVAMGSGRTALPGPGVGGQGDGLGDIALPSTGSGAGRKRSDSRGAAGDAAPTTGRRPSRELAYAPEPADRPAADDLPVAPAVLSDTLASLSADSVPRLGKRVGDQGFGRSRWRNTFPNLQHSGDWDCDRTAMLNLAHQFERRTGSILPFDSRNVHLGDGDLHQAPFLFMSGHSDFRFTDQEIVHLKDYIEKGGYMWVNDSTDVGDDRFDRAARRELPRLIDGADFRRIPTSHDLFKGPYDLSHGYKGYAVPPGDKFRTNYLEGIWVDDRLAVIYTRNDYGDGLEIDLRTAPLMASLTDLSPREMQEASVRMGTNIAMYCINNGRVSDVHFGTASDDTDMPDAVKERLKWDRMAQTSLRLFEDASAWFKPDWFQGDNYLAARVQPVLSKRDTIAVEFELDGHPFKSWWAQATVGRTNTFQFNSRHVVLLDVTSRLPGGARIALAFTGPGAVAYIETDTVFVRPGLNRNVAFDLGQPKLKTAQSNWELRASWPRGFRPEMVYVLTYPQQGHGRVEHGNLRVIER